MSGYLNPIPRWDLRRMRNSPLAGPALLLLLTVAMFWKLTLTDQYTWMDHPDMVRQVLPWFEFQAREWHDGGLPLWDPHQWGGQPLLDQVQPGTAYPLNWILFATPLRDGKLRTGYLHWYFVLLHYLAALFCYWLCLDLGRSRWAAILAGVIFGLGGYVGTMGWPQKLNGCIWAPLILLFFLRAFQGKRPWASIALAGAFMGISLLSGHHQIPILFGLVLGGFWLYFLFGQPREWRRNSALILLFGAVTGLISAPQVLPALEYGKLAVRWVGTAHPVGWGEHVPYTIHSAFGLYPLSILGIVIAGIRHNTSPFIGFVAVAFALIGVAACWRTRVVRLLTAAAVGAFLFSLASYCMFHGVLYSLVPYLEKARNPSVAIFVFHFAVAVLAAFGLDSTRETVTRQSAAYRNLVRGLAGTSAVFFLVLLGMSMVRAETGSEYERLAMAGIIALLLAVLLHGWRAGALPVSAALGLSVLLLMVELGNVTGWEYQLRDRPGSLMAGLSDYGDIAEQLKSYPEPVRVEISDKEIPYNFGDWYGIDQFRGFLASLTANVYYLMADYARFRRLMAVNLYVDRVPRTEKQEEIFTSRSGLKIFREPNAMPRVWTVHQVSSIVEAKQASVAFTAPDFDLARQSFVVGEAPELASCDGADTVRLVSRGTDSAVVEAEMQCTGMVILSETFYPGWKATLDGKPVKLYAAYGALRGVVTGSGKHRIEFRYRPWKIYLGIILALLGLLVVLAFQVAGRRRASLTAPGNQAE